MAFQIVPIEINEHIASYLTNDKDLCRFTLICPKTYQAVHSACYGVWRKRFVLCYDLPAGMRGHDLKVQYQLRRMHLNPNLSFVNAQGYAELACLETIRKLVVESYSTPSKPLTTSRNLTQLRRYTQKSNILTDVLRTTSSDGHVNPLLQTIQLLFFPWSLEFSLDASTWAFPYSQQAVYGHPDDFPMFEDPSSDCTINMELLLHMANFFKYHMTREEEFTLFHLFSELPEDEKPKAWQGKLKQGVHKLGRFWKGSYSYLHDIKDIPSLRANEPGSAIYTDTIDYADGLQSLELDFHPPKRSPPMPAAFDRHLHSMPTPTLVSKLNNANDRMSCSKTPLNNAIQGPAKKRRTTALPPRGSAAPAREDRTPKEGVHYLRFTGTGYDAEPYLCVGIVHALPPQHDIPGWQRVTLMKYFDPSPPPSFSSFSPSISPPTTITNQTDKDKEWSGNNFSASSSNDKTDRTAEHEHEDNDNGCWAYEGIVLPGGMCMLGRWWSPAEEGDERMCTGPFVFWDVGGGC